MTIALLIVWFRWAEQHRQPVDFTKQIRPVFEERCQPCHFQGGKMYERLPFDRPQTIVRLGTKLFTRIRDEKTRDLIRQFLAQKGKP